MPRKISNSFIFRVLPGEFPGESVEAWTVYDAVGLNQPGSIPVGYMKRKEPLPRYFLSIWNQYHTRRSRNGGIALVNVIWSSDHDHNHV